MKNLKEACGVFACYNAENAPITTFYGLMALQHRGQDSCGILWMDKDEIKIKRGKGLLKWCFWWFKWRKIFRNFLNWSC